MATPSAPSPPAASPHLSGVAGTEMALDLRHLRCPMPVLRTRKALGGLAPGSLLVVSCTDPLASIDIPHLVNQEGDTLISVETRDGTQIFSIRKG